MRLPNPWSMPLITIAAAAQLLHISESTARRMAQRGELPTVPVGAGKRVPVATLYELLGLPIPTRPQPPRVD